jgi:hypothetical protein
MGDEAAELAPGDRVRLTRAVGDLPSGSLGVVIGFFRREPESIVLKCDGEEGLIEVRPGELERVDVPPPG